MSWLTGLELWWLKCSEVWRLKCSEVQYSSLRILRYVGSNVQSIELWLEYSEVYSEM
jgi:hypothetical protein